MRSAEADNGLRDADGSDGDRASQHRKHIEYRRVINDELFRKRNCRAVCDFVVVACSNTGSMFCDPFSP